MSQTPLTGTVATLAPRPPIVTPLSPFEAPRLKIERARKHLSEFTAALDVYLARRPIRLIVERPWEMPFAETSHAWTVRVKEEPPRELATVIGDIVHNLRTALDHMACDLVRLAGKSAKGVYFPFCDNALDLPKMIKRRGFDLAGPEAVRMMKALKPYRGGNVQLRALHDLDIVDKHQALLPLFSAGVSPTAKVSFFGQAPTDIPSIQSAFSYDGQRLVIMPELGNVQLGSEMPLIVVLVFGEEAGLMHGHQIGETLNQFVDLTNSIVDLFQAKFAP